MAHDFDDTLVIDIHNDTMVHSNDNAFLRNIIISSHDLCTRPYERLTVSGLVLVVKHDSDMTIQ